MMKLVVLIPCLMFGWFASPYVRLRFWLGLIAAAVLFFVWG